DVQLRRNDLAGLTDLHVVGHEAGVHRGAGGANGSTQLVGQAVQQLEVVAVLHAATTGDHDLGTGQFGAVGRGQVVANKGGDAGVLGRGNGFDGGAATFGGHGVKAGGAYGDHLNRGVGLDGGDGVTGIDRTLEGVRALDADDLGDLVNVQQGGHARQVGVGGVAGHQHHGNTGDLGSGFRYCATAGTGNQYLDVATDGLGGRHGVQGGGIQCGVVVFGNNQNRHVRSPWLRSSVCRPARRQS